MKVLLREGAPYDYRLEAHLADVNGEPHIVFLKRQMPKEVESFTISDRALVLSLREFHLLARVFPQEDPQPLPPRDTQLAYKALPQGE